MIPKVGDIVEINNRKYPAGTLGTVASVIVDDDTSTVEGYLVRVDEVIPDTPRWFAPSAIRLIDRPVPIPTEPMERQTDREILAQMFGHAAGFRVDVRPPYSYIVVTSPSRGQVDFLFDNDGRLVGMLPHPNKS